VTWTGSSVSIGSLPADSGISAKSPIGSEGIISSIARSSNDGDSTTFFSGEDLPIVATEDEAGMERKEELGEIRTGGREGGLIDCPHIAAAALTFEGLFVGDDLFGDVPSIEADAEGEGEVGSTLGEVGLGDNDNSSNSSLPIDLESSPSFNSNSSSSFIRGEVGGLMMCVV
jgi:hypothetical protein